MHHGRARLRGSRLQARLAPRERRGRARPVPVSTGGPGEATPTGDFRVEWKHADHRSAEFNNAPMPFAVFFATGGIAFHEGNLNTDSAGCVRLEHSEAQAFFDFLQLDDPVQVR